MLGAAKDVEDKGMHLRVLAARAAAAEAACPQRRTFADPTIHNPSRSPHCRAKPGLNIMRRPCLEFEGCFAGGPDQAQEVLPSQSGEHEVCNGRYRRRPRPAGEQREVSARSAADARIRAAIS